MRARPSPRATTREAESHATAAGPLRLVLALLLVACGSSAVPPSAPVPTVEVAPGESSKRGSVQVARARADSSRWCFCEVQPSGRCKPITEGRFAERFEARTGLRDLSRYRRVGDTARASGAVLTAVSLPAASVGGVALGVSEDAHGQATGVALVSLGGALLTTGVLMLAGVLPAPADEYVHGLSLNQARKMVGIYNAATSQRR